jgi:diguanylate cyclase (GGDEF)-like protein
MKQRLDNLASTLEKRSWVFWVIFGLGLTVLLGVIDLVTGYELSFSLFYLAPISLVSWFAGRRAGLVISAACALTWLLADIGAGLTYLQSYIYFMNPILRLTFFGLVTLLLTELRRSLKSNQEMAHKDYLTGAASIRYFYDLCQMEIERSRRYGHPLTLAYLDLDDFKEVNDRYGHSTGNNVLQAVAGCIHQQVRAVDTVARLGGDEFALLLPETHQDDARTVITRIRDGLDHELQKKGWSVTLSIGVVTFQKMPGTVDEMVKMADDAMYAIKSNHKNGVKYFLYPELTLFPPLT